MAAGVALERPLALHSVVSEEDGGLGAFATMLRGHRGDAAVLTEPTSGRLVVANAGALTFRARSRRAARRTAAPGSRGTARSTRSSRPRRARSTLERERNADPDPLFTDHPLPYPISVGTVRAGDWASSVPDLLVAEGRLGVRLDEAPGRRARRARVAPSPSVARATRGCATIRCEVTWPGGQFASGRIDGAHPFIDEIARAIADVEGAVAPSGSRRPYGSDLRLYAGIGGIPTLHYGPGDVRFAHAPREQVPIDELVRTTQVASGAGHAEVRRAPLIVAERNVGGDDFPGRRRPHDDAAHPDPREPPALA